MNDELTQNDRREWARMLYTTQGMPLPEVARTVRVDQATMRCWVAEGSWDMVKSTLQLSKSTQLRHIYALTARLTEKLDSAEETNQKDVDLLMKYSSIAKSIEDNHSVYSLIEAAELFTTWLHHRDLELTQTFTQQFDIFIRYRMSL